MSGKILLVDDERTVRNALASVLEGAGYTVRALAHGSQAVDLVRTWKPDLVLLDVMMPTMDGLAVCKAIRSFESALPIIFLTALDSEEDEVCGLGCGADDYISKLSKEEVLLARIASQLRRCANVTTGNFAFGKWTIRPVDLTMINSEGVSVTLVEREVALMRMFREHPNEVITRDYLLRFIFGDQCNDITDAALSVTVARLRNKLGACGNAIQAVRSNGYAYRP